MNNKESNYELIKFEDGDFSLDVKVSPNENTVWLTQQQISDLYGRDISVISRHIRNIMYEKECTESNLQKMQIPFSDKPVVFYDLEFIISIGYRIKSKRGVMFRRWANSILKQYLLNGYAINKDRVIAYQSNILKLEASFIDIENRLKDLEETVYSNNNQLIYEGEILEPYSFLRKLFFLAKNEIIITDYYADSFLISMLKDIKVKITIITSTRSYLNNIVIPNNINIINNDDIHGRYIFIDKYVYAMDHSFNAIGKKRFIIIRLENITKNMLLKGIIKKDI
ncbi:MAG: virulence RhuM family protein [Bacilli bacterium]|nr:virulence RhuM family protein [Bacilli bacterium]